MSQFGLSIPLSFSYLSSIFSRLAIFSSRSFNLASSSLILFSIISFLLKISNFFGSFICNSSILIFCNNFKFFSFNFLISIFKSFISKSSRVILFSFWFFVQPVGEMQEQVRLLRIKTQLYLYFLLRQTLRC